jgi:hypothetical protein
VGVTLVERVAGDMRAAVDDENAELELAGDPFGHDRAGEAGADDEDVDVVKGGSAHPTA